MRMLADPLHEAGPGMRLVERPSRAAALVLLSDWKQPELGPHAVEVLVGEAVEEHPASDLYFTMYRPQGLGPRPNCGGRNRRNPDTTGTVQRLGELRCLH